MRENKSTVPLLDAIKIFTPKGRQIEYLPADPRERALVLIAATRRKCDGLLQAAKEDARDGEYDLGRVAAVDARELLDDLVTELRQCESDKTDQEEASAAE